MIISLADGTLRLFKIYYRINTIRSLKKTLHFLTSQDEEY